MTFNAVLVARRGLGVEELRLLTPEMSAAVRWAVMAESMVPRLEAAEEVARTEPSNELLGLKSDPAAERQKALAEFRARRERARKFAAQWRPILFPDDEVTGDG